MSNLAGGVVAAAQGVDPATLARTITIGTFGSNSAGYSALAGSGSLSDDSFGTDTIERLVDTDSFSPATFQIVIDNDTLAQDAFDELRIEHSGGVKVLKSADASFSAGSGSAVWNWDSPPYWDDPDAGEVYGWDIDGS